MIIAIMDDTMRGRELLKGILGQYFSGYQTIPEIQEFESGKAFLEVYKPGRYSVIFFDIYMGGTTGMKMAPLIYERDKDCRLVFFSSDAGCAVDGYRVGTVYYLTKPLSYGNLALILDCFTREPLETERGLTVIVRGEVEAMVPFNKLLYVNNLKRMVQIHISGTILGVAESFMVVSGRLMSGSGLLCCNRGTYVNIDWIQEMRDSVIRPKNGETLPVRVRDRTQTKKEYMEYALKDLRR